MRKFRFVGLRFVLFGIVWAGVMGLVVTGLWNALLPGIVGVRAISFWQALGLLILSRVLFGRLGGWDSWMRKSRFVRGWKDLTPEERQRFRQAMGSCRPGKFGQGEAGETPAIGGA
ncbi:MAG TPA: hypothetical protein VHU83_00480 [Bryobacteraceae bacterium]|jgi:hypothetical protein|nr:hypothetical protein [Bryobacteraceae bacterium]